MLVEFLSICFSIIFPLKNIINVMSKNIELETRNRHIWIQGEILDFLVQISILSDARGRRYSFAHVSSIISAPNWVRDSDLPSLDSGRNFGFFGADFDFVRCTGRALQFCARFLDYFDS